MNHSKTVFISIFMCTLWFCFSAPSVRADEAGAKVLGSIEADHTGDNFKGICSKCHKEQIGKFQKSPHQMAFYKEGKYSDDASQCIACHGEPTEHLKVKEPIMDTMFGWTKEARAAKGHKGTNEELNEQCLACHKNFKKVAFWKNDKHSQEDVLCSSCHTVHKPSAVSSKLEMSNKCLACHKDVGKEAQKYSHHPIIEGKVGCADCHTPHQSLSDKSLAASSVNQLCYKCHADKRGPFVWAHPPVQENCLTCHNQHGSRNRMLLVERAPQLCEDCHAGTPHRQAIYGATTGFAQGAGTKIQALGRSCVNCHTKIHGSNAPADPAGAGDSLGQYFLR